MPDSLPYAVIGATGQQGGAVVDALLAAGHPVRALTRDPDSRTSRGLAARGVTLARADQEDRGSLETALGGVEALFMMTTYSGKDGTDGEVRHGRTIVDAAVAAGVPRAVYSSVGGAERHSGVPHFESKRRVEEHLTGALPATVVRPTFFMENFAQALSGADEQEFVLRFPIPGDVPLQMVAVQDIGRVAAALLVDPARAPGGAVEIAGDELTGDEIAARIGAFLGKPSRFEPLSLEVLGDDEDRKSMMRWFVDTPAYEADFAATRAIDPAVLDFTAWLVRRG